MSKPYMADISFLQPVIDAYKYGAFEDKGLPNRVINALDSLSWYGNVKIPDDLPVRTVPVRKKSEYTKRSDYWKNKAGDSQSELKDVREDV